MVMASSTFLLLFLLLTASFLTCRSYDASQELFQNLNKYRTSMRLPIFTGNDNADCLANQLAENFKGQPCTNTSGAYTVQGTEQQFPNYPDFLDHCRLNASVTRDGAIMPACVPGLDPRLVLANYTKTPYSGNLNKTQYAGAGIADEGDWIVVVLTTNTPTGNFATTAGGGRVLELSVGYQLMALLLGTVLVLLI